MFTLSSKLLIICIILSISGISINPSNAEEIRIPIGQQAEAAPPIDLPNTGMTKARVLSLFGDPLEQTPARGQPPISQWKYTEFIVYFEYDHVIHSVRVFQPNTNTVILEE